MRILYDIGDIPTNLNRAVVALGNFDGVHRGHLAVLENVKSTAKKLNSPSGVLTFFPHPRSFLKIDQSLFSIISLERKLSILEIFNLDFVNVLTFDTALSDLTAEDFVRKIIVGSWRATHVTVGYNFFFGKGRCGTPHMLQEFGVRYGFGVTIVKPARNSSNVFSSSAVRELLQQGEVRKAANILGHWWTVSGVVEHGANRGTEMGFPTVNIALEPGQSLQHGIYAARVWVDGRRFDGAAYSGCRPTFDNGPAKLEVFLLNFSGCLYDRKIYIEFIDFIRLDKSFENAEALAKQISKDCTEARKILASINSADPMLRFPVGKALALKMVGVRK
ncbi:MAG: bifunctional riboflavin kinase/FAD synthetase [Hyphomicrobiaceae bacterium]|nr:bifunctional riboflavin kinase/FAD synthetase [Hyphomicrobiaceae bacterium]